MLLSDAEFKSDIAGRIRNTALPAKDFLLPLYEAIVNSIQAIKESNRKDGKIKITVYREALLGDHDPREVADITGFDIWDNGSGFTDDNLESFMRVDSTYKQTIGGKGLGRFVWHKAFDNVCIESHYKQGTEVKYRSFRFISSNPGIAEPTEKKSSEKDTSTTIHLRGFLKPYIERSCKTSTLAILIVSYCFDYLSSDACPEIVVTDESSTDTININKLFQSEIIISAAHDSFLVGDQTFNIKHVLLNNTHIRQHKICYCADKRVVQEDKLTDAQLPDLEDKIDVDTKPATYVAYLSSSFLDKAANNERTVLSILDDFEANGKEITWKNIRPAVLENVKKFLESHLTKNIESKREVIEKFIKEDGIEYAPLKSQLDIDTISIDVAKNPKKLDLELHKRRQELELNARKEGQELLAHVPDENEEEYSRRLENYFNTIDTLNSSALTKYVCARKAILEIFEGLLKQQSNKKYPLEKAIHNLIFAMGADSETNKREHNLWIIDERLSFQNYIASDKKYTSMPMGVSGSKEPDIAVFHNAYSFSDETPTEAVTIIEFKRPDRDDYSRTENPIEQLYENLEELLTGKRKTEDGIRLNGRLERFYCYAICTITPTLEAIIRKETFLQKSPEGYGYFGYHDKYKAFIEIIDFQKLLADAKKRNKAFFKKLGLPT